ncbi:MAG: glycosyltransferase [Bacteroidaceae bacterium]|nr:glycosyltransferase [Bacteroidaceae bacterium]
MTLSIITINFNNLDGLKATRQSILAQTYKDWEWIVIDGGSTQGDREFIEEHQSETAYWCSEPDRGVYHAMNKGIAAAKGDYFIFMNSGDTFYDIEVLTHVFKQLRTEDVLYGDWVQVHPNGETSLSLAPKVFSLHFICSDNICHQAMFLKGELMRQSPYDESFRLYADWAKWIQWALNGYSFCYIPVTICAYDMGGISVTQKALIIKEHKRLQTDIIPTAMRTSLNEMQRLYKIINEMHPLVLEASRLIEKKKLFKKIIHTAIRLCHIFE